MTSWRRFEQNVFVCCFFLLPSSPSVPRGSLVKVNIKIGRKIMMASLEDVVAGAIPNVSDCFPKGGDNTQTKDKNNSLTKGSDNTQTKDIDRLL